MIKFFRKIRQRLLAENKVSRYLLYAIGEIVLVVIGILFALQINSWNEQRVNQNKQHELLHDLKVEFEYNQEALLRAVEINRSAVQACIDFTSIIRDGTVMTKTDTVDELLVSVVVFSSFDGRTGVCDEIINSGKLYLIQNKVLRSRLTNWAGWLLDARENVSYNSRNYTNNLMPFLLKHFPLTNGERFKQMNGLADDSNLQRYPGVSPFSQRLESEDLMELENQIWHHKDALDWVILSDLETNKHIIETLELIEDELAKQ